LRRTVLISALVLGALSERARAPIVEPAPGRRTFYHGVFPGGESGRGSDVTPAGVAEYARAARKRPAWVYCCDNWYEDREFPWKTALWIREGGSVPYIRLMLMSRPSLAARDPVFNTRNINAGRLAAVFRSLVGADPRVLDSMPARP
jgi:hypothetical protein